MTSVEEVHDYHEGCWPWDARVLHDAYRLLLQSSLWLFARLSRDAAGLMLLTSAWLIQIIAKVFILRNLPISRPLKPPVSRDPVNSSNHIKFLLSVFVT